MRTNIYSLESLTPEVKDAVREGVTEVAARIGQAVVFRECRVKLALTDRGTVNPNRIGFANLEHLTELHIIAVPLDRGESERIGLAQLGRGVGFVDIASGNDPLIRTTTAHETAHSIGFVSSGARNENPESEHHCSDNDCIMYRYAITQAASEPTQSLFKLSRKVIMRRRVTSNTPVASLQGQQDFCDDCKADIASNGAERINELRHRRLLRGRV
jgi:hypothetical protein